MGMLFFPAGTQKLIEVDETISGVKHRAIEENLDETPKGLRQVKCHPLDEQ